MTNLPVRIRTTSRVFGTVEFELVGRVATQHDRTGEFFSPTLTHDSSMKWILDQLNHMIYESPDLTFIS